MLDVAPSAGRPIELLQSPVKEAHPPLQPRPVRRHAIGGLAKHDREQIRDSALLHPQRAAGVGFAELISGSSSMPRCAAFVMKRSTLGPLP